MNWKYINKDSHKGEMKLCYAMEYLPYIFGELRFMSTVGSPSVVLPSDSF